MSFISKSIVSTVIAVMALLPVHVHAQSSDFAAQNYGQNEARLGINIPFGAHRNDAVAKPKLALTVRHYNQDKTANIDWMLKPDRDVSGRYYSEHDISLTLTKNPHVFINDQQMVFYNDTAPVSDDVKTAGKIGLVALGVVAVAGAAFVIVALESGGLSGGPDD